MGNIDVYDSIRSPHVRNALVSVSPPRGRCLKRDVWAWSIGWGEHLATIKARNPRHLTPGEGDDPDDCINLPSPPPSELPTSLSSRPSVKSISFPLRRSHTRSKTWTSKCVGGDQSVAFVCSGPTHLADVLSGASGKQLTVIMFVLFTPRGNYLLQSMSTSVNACGSHKQSTTDTIYYIVSSGLPNIDFILP